MEEGSAGPTGCQAASMLHRRALFGLYQLDPTAAPPDLRCLLNVRNARAASRGAHQHCKPAERHADRERAGCGRCNITMGFGCGC